MFFTIARKEILGNTATYKFPMALSLLYVLLLTGTLVGLRDLQRDLKMHDANVAAHRRDLEEVVDVRSLMLAGITVDRRPSDLRVFAQGLDQVIPRSVTLSPVAPPRAGEDIHVNPLTFLFRQPDFAYVMQAVASLLALLFSFDAVSGERERGTLALTLCNSVPRDMVLAGKWVGGYLSVLLTLAPAAATTIGLFLLTLPAVSADLVWRTLAIVAVTLLYVSLFYTLGLLVSAAVQRSVISLLLGLALWVCLVPGIPSLAPTLAKVLTQVPSKAQVTEWNLAVEREEELDSRGNYGRCRDQDCFAEVWASMRSEVRRRQREVEERVSNATRARSDLAANLSRLSPAASYAYAVTDLASTGLDEYRRFDLAVATHLTRLAEYEKLFTLSARSQTFDPGKVPAFDYRPRPLSHTIRGIGPDVLILALGNVVLFMSAYVVFLRADVVP